MGMRVVAIDGGSGAGKTTLAAELAARLPDSRVVHTDDLLDGWADQFGFWPRLRTQVLAPLLAGQAATFVRYDWVAGRFGDVVSVEPGQFLLIEGVSAIAACGASAGLRILLDVPRAERERRGQRRDGVTLSAEWLRWFEAEERFFAENPPQADIRLTATRLDDTQLDALAQRIRA
jgi:uridine kinase